MLINFSYSISFNKSISGKLLAKILAVLTPTNLMPNPYKSFSKELFLLFSILSNKSPNVSLKSTFNTSY